MKFDRRKTIVLAFMVALLLFNLSARVHIRLKIRDLRLMQGCHENLLAAYKSGGREAVSKEIERMYAHVKRPAAKEFLEGIREKIDESDNPVRFLNAEILHEKKAVYYRQCLLLIINVLALTFIIWRIVKMRKKSQKA